MKELEERKKNFTLWCWEYERTPCSFSSKNEREFFKSEEEFIYFV